MQHFSSNGFGSEQRVLHLATVSKKGAVHPQPDATKSDTMQHKIKKTARRCIFRKFPAQPGRSQSQKTRRTQSDPLFSTNVKTKANFHPVDAGTDGSERSRPGLWRIPVPKRSSMRWSAAVDTAPGYIKQFQKGNAGARTREWVSR
jgi:hypothetical protein